MGKKHFSELSDHDHLNQGPQGDDQDKQGIARHRKAPDRLCCQASYARQQQPAEKYQRNGDFVPVKLGQKLSDGEQLSGNGAYARTDDGPYDQAFVIYH